MSSANSLPQSAELPLSTLQPVVDRPINRPIRFTTPLGTLATGQGSILSTLTIAGSLRPYLTNYKSVRVLRATLYITAGANIAQAASCDVIWAMVPNSGNANDPNIVSAAATITNAQSGAALLTNAGFTNSGTGSSAGVYAHELFFDQNGISSQLVGTILGNQAVPIIRIFANVSGGSPSAPSANQLGLYAWVSGEVEVEGPF